MKTYGDMILAGLGGILITFLLSYLIIGGMEENFESGKFGGFILLSILLVVFLAIVTYVIQLIVVENLDVLKKIIVSAIVGVIIGGGISTYIGVYTTSIPITYRYGETFWQKAIGVCYSKRIQEAPYY
jgi:hypothetical protein